MSRVFISDGTGAGIYVFSDDHCPAHVHARHRGDGWIARVKFSYLDDAVDLTSIAPVKNIPLQRVVNRLLSDVRGRLPDCRRSWWLTRGTTCLANQWGIVNKAGKIELHSRPVPGAKQIAEAEYETANERVRVMFQDGTRVQVNL
ncbi:MAG: hypothetical protein U1F35_06955 [Steroidobacteraceae bacterium]